VLGLCPQERIDDAPYISRTLVIKNRCAPSISNKVLDVFSVGVILLLNELSITKLDHDVSSRAPFGIEGLYLDNSRIGETMREWFNKNGFSLEEEATQKLV
jgi:hypothetical protein